MTRELLDSLPPKVRQAFGTPEPAQPSTSLGRVNRRDFFKIGAAATGGLLVSLYMPSASAKAAPATAVTLEPNAFVRIDPDNTVTIMITRSDMGQGVRTALAMILAEELDADWDTVRIEQASLDPKYGNQGTGGSASVRSNWQRLREAGAAARQMLITAAAQQWSVEPSACITEPGRVVHEPSDRSMSYGELTEAAVQLPVPEQVTLKDPSAFRIIGKGTKHLDVPDIVTGQAQYGIDVTVPGMKYAAVARPLVFGATVASFDAAEARQVPGVRDVVEIPAFGRPSHVPGGVAVIADNTWAAFKGRDALKIEWNDGPHASETTAQVRETMRSLTSEPMEPVYTKGDTDGTLAQAEAVHTAEYELPYLSHATMEPQNCTAHVEGNRCTIWGPTQTPEWAASAAAEVLGIPEENVDVHVTLLGGGFGRRLLPDYAAEAAFVSKAAGVPVKVVWTREDDMRRDFYRPMNHHRLDASLDAKGVPQAWRHRMSTTAIQHTIAGPDSEGMHRSEIDGTTDLPYRIPHQQVEYALAPSGLTRAWWRSVTHSFTGFIVESFIDELAHQAGADPYEYRRNLIDLDVQPDPDDPYAFDPRRLKRVLELAAEKAEWGTPLPEGVGRGIACHWSFLSYAAEVVEASVNDDGTVQVHRVVAAIDCGQVVNPDGAEAQCQSAIVDGLSTALKSEITVDGGQVVQGNFDEYLLLRMNEAPKVIDVHFVESDAPPSGLGEPALPPVMPALTNALYAATGKRLRKLPIKPEDLVG